MRRRIGEDENLAGACYHVDGNVALYHALGSGDEDVARSGDDIHGRDGLCAEGEGRHGPCTPRPDDVGDAQDVGGGEQVRIESAVGTRGRGYGDARHASHLSGDGVHQQT